MSSNTLILQVIGTDTPLQALLTVGRGGEEREGGEREGGEREGGEREGEMGEGRGGGRRVCSVFVCD